MKSTTSVITAARIKPDHLRKHNNERSRTGHIQLFLVCNKLNWTNSRLFSRRLFSIYTSIFTVSSMCHSFEETNKRSKMCTLSHGANRKTEHTLHSHYISQSKFIHCSSMLVRRRKYSCMDSEARCMLFIMNKILGKDK